MALAALAAGCAPDRPRAGLAAAAFPADSVLAARRCDAAAALATISRIDTVATGLDVPWAMAFAPGGRLFVTERPGRVRVIENGALLPEPWATLDVFARDSALLPESGLMGIAIDRDFADSRHLYVYGTFETGRRRYENRIYQLTDSAGRGAHPRELAVTIPANYYHAGGALAFDPDGVLHLTTGDGLRPGQAQSRGGRAGRVLRLAGDSLATIAFGLRNSQGLAWDSATGALFAIDHGPTGMDQERGRTGGDELNVIVPGGNYGWDRVSGHEPVTGMQPPLRVWPFALAPAGLAMRGRSLFITGLRGVQLRHVVVDHEAGGWRVVQDDSLLVGTHGRLRAVAFGPDGALYVGTSNRDGRGAPGPADDLILRLELSIRRPPGCPA